MNSVTAARAAALLLLPVYAAACREADTGSEWDPAAARAVARHVQEQNPAARVVVLGTEGAGGAELPWAVRQALTTGGVEVVDRDPADPGTALLVLERSARSNDVWLIDALLHAAPAAGTAPPERARWRVSCRDEQCTVNEAT